MDTTMTRTPACEKAGYAPYYAVQAKYPRSSETLAKGAQTFLQGKPKHRGSGYVTFRFVVDCQGNRLPRVEVLQTDARYQQFHFPKELVNNLYAYFKTLTDWPAAVWRGEMRVNYIAYLTFKITNGKVVAVIP